MNPQTPPPCAAGPWRPGTEASRVPLVYDDDRGWFRSPGRFLVQGPGPGLAVAYLEQFEGEETEWGTAGAERWFYPLSDVLWFAEIREQT